MPEQEYALRPDLVYDEDSEQDEVARKVKFFDEKSSYRSDPSFNSVVTQDLFRSGIDDIIYEGELHKFKPGLSCNFVARHVQISKRAFRYFRN